MPGGANNEQGSGALQRHILWIFGNRTVQGKKGIIDQSIVSHADKADESLRQKFGRRLQDRKDFSFNFDADFQVASYLKYQGKKFVDRFDANAFLYITKAADYFDIKRKYGKGSLVKAFEPVKAKFLVISFTSDWLYPTFQSRDITQTLKKNGRDVSFCEIEANCGHDAFLLPSARLSAMIKGFLNSVSSRIST